MTVRRGTRRLVIVASVLYALGALVGAFIIGANAKSAYLALTYATMGDRAFREPNWGISWQEFNGQFWPTLFAFALIYGFGWGVFLIIRWVVRGFRAST